MSLISRGAAAPDPFFPSTYFAKVPAEVLSPLAHAGGAAMSHAEFRVFIALCRFRGATRIVNPTRITLGSMTGLTPNNISRATQRLQAKGWLTIHYAGDQPSREVENYELHLSSNKTPAKRTKMVEEAQRSGSPLPRRGSVQEAGTSLGIDGDDSQQPDLVVERQAFSTKTRTERTKSGKNAPLSRKKSPLGASMASEGYEDAFDLHLTHCLSSEELEAVIAADAALEP